MSFIKHDNFLYSLLLVLIVAFYPVFGHAHNKEGLFTNVQGKLYYKKMGHGDEVLLFVHGLPLSSESWRQATNYFKNDYSILLVDLPGYGKSPNLDTKTKNLSYAYVSLIVDLIDHLNIKKVTYIGFATGGHVGIALASHYPSRVNKLILINTSPLFAKKNNWQYGFDNQAIKQFNDIITTKSMAKIAAFLLEPAMQDIKPGSPFIASFYHMTSQCTKKTFYNFFNIIAKEDFRPLLSTIKAKTLIIHSILDKEVDVKVAEYMNDNIAHSTLKLLPNADHFVIASRPQLINKIIDSFL